MKSIAFVTVLYVFAFWHISASWADNLKQTEIVSGTLKFSDYFFGKTAGEKGCLNGTVHPVLLDIKSDEEAEDIIKSVIGFDWVTEHAKNSNSLSVKHQKISIPTRQLFALAQRAVSENDAPLKSTTTKLLVDIADANTLLETPSIKEIRSKGGRCYAGSNDTTAVCKFHVTQFATQFGGNFLIAASLLKADMSADQQFRITQYADALHKKFIHPMFIEMHQQKTQFSQMANGGINVLAYAFWKNDEDLARDTLAKIFANIDRVFMDDGYIKGTSFRGVRGFWYHSYGTNSALAVIALADLWNVKTPDHIYQKVKKATELLNVGINNVNDFYARPDPDGTQYNASYDEKDSRHHLHQMATGIAQLAKIAVGVEVNIKDDRHYKINSPSEYPSDFTIGFNPNCMTKE